MNSEEMVLQGLGFGDTSRDYLGFWGMEHIDLTGAGRRKKPNFSGRNLPFGLRGVTALTPVRSHQRGWVVVAFGGRWEWMIDISSSGTEIIPLCDARLDFVILTTRLVTRLCTVPEFEAGFQPSLFAAPAPALVSHGPRRRCPRFWTNHHPTAVQ